ncbi:CPBP family intramembrane glutamic endopeptidase [Tenacibaculum sp. M341]|uniref:CPBP family intramembrane glutamic endopeptidase n=1 Tax=Tenacibaculum sp. M341 TaxID=2530339 RepID=UPI001046F7AC|nr:CPBP family intramembrane glutamic endopeptidase [Tenacibaculum sp. M341]TCI93636.1 CPBP family intramembrane metalloprotease [Tenacibaculum sp. M341]
MRKIIFNSKDRVRPIWRLFLFLILTFLINIPLQLILQQLLDQSLLRGYISASMYLISVVFSLFIDIKFLDKSSFKKYGLKINKIWLQEFLMGAIIPVVQLSIFFFVLYSTDNLKVIDFFTTNSANYSFDYSFWAGFFSEIFGLIIGSTVEEIFFRAFIFYIAYEAFQVVKKDAVKRAILIVVIIAPLFGIAHMGNEGATTISTTNLGIDAIVMCLPFLITGRLGMSIGMHFSWNLVEGAILGFAVSGNVAKSSIISVEMPNNLLTGGVFGPEGSIIFILLDVVAIALILYWKRIKNYNSLVNPYIIENDIK